MKNGIIIAILIIIFLILILFISNRVISHNDNIFIYCLNNDTGVKTGKEVRLPKEAIISIRDIQSYKWEEHEIVLTEEGWEKINKKITMQNLGTTGISFLLTINSKILYRGFFWSILYASKPDTPVILYENLQNGIFKISTEKNQVMLDNKELYDFLLKFDKLHK